MRTYETVDRLTMPARETEAAVLTTAAKKLKDCQANWDAPDREARLEEALKYNQKVWSVFQAELASEDNPLPKKLRIDILRLSAFIDRRIFEIMAFPEREKLGIIININSNLAAGLRSSTKA
jgi:flagellar protein FlaF